MGREAVVLNKTFELNFNTSPEPFVMSFMDSGSSRDIYGGSYVIIPRPESQMLETASKIMTDDVLCREIPYHPVSNDFGGLTVTIGGE